MGLESTIRNGSEVMNVKITPHKPGDGGIACMPLKRNIPEASRNPDWKLVECPVCRAECWESDLTRQIKAEGCSAACTLCALRAGIK